MNDHDIFEQAIEEAKLALDRKEVAVGCVFYHAPSKKIISRGRNNINASKNATRHAEINCIDDLIIYCTNNGIESDKIWSEIDVYVTCEPCIMCARILRHLQVRRVIYGCSNERFGGCLSVINVANLKDINEKPLEYVSNMREKETIDLLKRFYSGENENAPLEMRKKKPKLV